MQAYTGHLTLSDHFISILNSSIQRLAVFFFELQDAHILWGTPQHPTLLALRRGYRW